MQRDLGIDGEAEMRTHAAVELSQMSAGGGKDGLRRNGHAFTGQAQGGIGVALAASGGIHQPQGQHLGVGKLPVCPRERRTAEVSSDAGSRAGGSGQQARTTPVGDPRRWTRMTLGAEPVGQFLVDTGLGSRKATRGRHRRPVTSGPSFPLIISFKGFRSVGDGSRRRPGIREEGR